MLKDAMHSVSLLFEVAGVAVILGGFGFALAQAMREWPRRGGVAAYEALRRVFGKSILLGLEVLVAADLIRTIAVEPTLGNLYVLALLVAIRTFLSWSLDVELEGVWPWRKRDAEHGDAACAPATAEGRRA